MIIHGNCPSAEILDFVKNEITEVLEYRELLNNMQAAEIEAILS